MDNILKKATLMAPYVEFAVTSNFSFLRGASHPEELMAEAARLKISGLGLADRNSVAGVVRAHVAKRESGLKLAYHPGARLVFAALAGRGRWRHRAGAPRRPGRYRGEAARADRIGGPRL